MNLTDTIINALSAIGINAGPNDAEVRRFLDRAASGENVTQYTVWQDWMNRSQTAYDLVMGPIQAAQAIAPVVQSLPEQNSMASPQAIQNVVEVYKEMGHPDAWAGNPDIVNWADSGATRADILAAASTYINDPVWGTVGAKAAELLQATPGAVVSAEVQQDIAAFWNGLGMDPSKPHATVPATRYPPPANTNVVYDDFGVVNAVKSLSPGAMAALALAALLILRR